MVRELDQKAKSWVEDAAIATLLALIVVATRLPFRTHLLFNWDAVNFAFAMESFDVRRHFPHPPGYPYFVALGRAFQTLLADANTALVAESILFSALAVVVLYFLGKALFDRRTGIIAALLLTGSVTFWSLGEVALAYTSLAFFSSLAALLAYKTLKGEKRLVLALAVVCSLGSGFRPDLLLFLGPLFAASLYRQPWLRAAGAVAIAIIGFGAWFLPTIALSGGFAEYWAVLRGYMNEDVVNRYSLAQHGMAALAVSIRDTAAYTFYALYATTLPLLAALFIWAWRRSLAGIPWAFLLLWLSPMLLFYAFFHIGDPGYAFTFLPGLLLLPARFLAQLKRPGLALLGAVLLANSLIFLLHPRTRTLPGLRQHQTALATKLAYIAESYPPDSVHIIAFESYRQVQYYLRGYSAQWIDLRDAQHWEEGLPPGRELLLFDPSLAQAWDAPPSPEAVSLAPDIALYRLPNASGMLVRDGFKLRLRGP